MDRAEGTRLDVLRSESRTRRIFLRTAPLAAGTLAAALAACGPQRAGPPGDRPAATKGPVAIKLQMWDYRPDIVRSNVDRFEQENPGVKVDGPETGPCCAVYRQRMNTNFLAGEAMDAMYLRDEDVAEWAEANWIRVLDDMPGSKELAKDEYGFVHIQTHYKGKRYGTIYYIGLQEMLYNRAHLQQVGISKPPETLDQLREAALQLKRQRVVEFPIWGTPSYALVVIAYLATGGKVFDEKTNALFGKDPMFKQIVDWHIQAFQGDKIFGSVPDVQAPFDNGKSSFTWTSFYDLKRLNGMATGAVAGAGQPGGGAAGQLMNGLNPGLAAGKTGGDGICRQYAVAKESKHPLETWKLISFLGGKDKAGQYSVAKRWWLEQGLWFGYKPLEQDPEVRKSAEGWGDIVIAGKVIQGAQPRPGIAAPWSDKWRTDMGPLFTEIMQGQRTSKDGIEEAVRQWDIGRSEWERAHGKKWS